LNNAAEQPDAAPRWHGWVRPALAGAAFVMLNIIAYRWLASPAGKAQLERLGDFDVLGAFLVMLIANATVVVPVPWPALLIPIAQQSSNVGAVILAGALGSAIGETVAFVIGRSGRGKAEDTRLYRWIQRQLAHPWRAFLVLFGLSAPPNPLFDVAGLTAGAMGLPFWLFFTAVALARIIRIWIIIAFAGALGL
jgi:membrane protein YqaA with SNARE-associated domain